MGKVLRIFPPLLTKKAVKVPLWWWVHVEEAFAVELADVDENLRATPLCLL